MLTVQQILSHIEKWAPPGVAWSKDNVGIQIGDRATNVSGILISLDMNRKILNEAIKKKCNLIITHHPFIFTPLKNLDFAKDPKAQIISDLITNKISIISAHTNLDYTKDGVNYQLAKQLGLSNIKFLENHSKNQYKLIIFSPTNSTENMIGALNRAGFGIIGDYPNCSFSSAGTGQFSRPDSEEKISVDEDRIEIIINKWDLPKAKDIISKNHPYNEPAFDIIPLENENLSYGAGAKGVLNKSLSKNEFLKFVCNSLKIKNLRYSNGSGKRIKNVAVFGGSGIDGINSAIKAGMDAFITADVKYHQFQDAEGKILLIDAGHYETEFPVLKEIRTKIQNFAKIKQEDVRVIVSSQNINPINFFNITGE